MIDEVQSGRVAEVPLRGEIDVQTCQELRQELHALIDEGVDRLVLQLDDLHFVDSTALGMLIGLHRRLRDEGGSLELRTPTGPVRRALAVSGLDQVLRITE